MSPRHVPLFPALPTSGELTLSDVLGFVFEYHLRGLPCYRPFMSVRRAWCKTSGHLVYQSMNEPDVTRHVNMRRNGEATGNAVGAQQIKHDLKVLTLCDNMVRKWKKKGYAVGGYDFSQAALPFDNPAGDVKRPKTKPRKRPVDPNTFARWLEHAPERLRRRSIFLMDTGLNPIEVKRLRTADYSASRDGFYVQRGKSGEIAFLPASARCSLIAREAVAEGREFIVPDWTNEQGDIEENRRRSGVSFWLGRDPRCAYYNEVLKRTGRDYKAAQRAMLHSDSRTGPEHYEVDDGRDIRKPIQELSEAFSVGEKSV